MTTASRAANVLGALALVITDQTARAVEGASRQSVSAATALSALHHFLDRPTLDQLRKVLGLTPSGAVRLVDRLAEAGLVTRGPGQDGRSRSLTLTEEGRQVAQRVAQARAEVLGGALAQLSPAEQQTLHSLLSRVLADVVRSKDGGAWTCRLCDTESCERLAGRCPAANAAAARRAAS